MRVDCHVHVVGPPARYPQVADRNYIAAPAPLETLKALGGRRGVSRFVIVQPSFYGTDNSATLDAASALGPHGRAVAVIDPAAAPRAMLDGLARRGVRGLRLNLYSPLGAVPKHLEGGFPAVAGAAAAMGWHVQVVASLQTLLENAQALAASPAPVVIDHYGLYGAARPADAEGSRLLELVRQPHVWVKLSAPYRMAHGALNTRPDREWLAAMLEAAPGRCVWGSDWPHPPEHAAQKGPDVEIPYRALSYVELLDEFVAALPTGFEADRILVGNAERLYGF